jgi:hypothetical protein
MHPASELRHVSSVVACSYYYQAEVFGQVVTWLAPHATSQVLPPDVDYKVMLTFLEFHTALLQVGGPPGAAGCATAASKPQPAHQAAACSCWG